MKDSETPIIIEGIHEAIIEKEIFDKVQHIKKYSPISYETIQRKSFIKWFNPLP